MSLVWIFGPPAVGKMTVGMELEKLTGFPLFHAHLTIELVLPFFPFGHPAFHRLVNSLRRQVMDEVAQSDLPGLIYTYVWALNEPGDKEYVDGLTGLFASRGHEVLFVELQADLTARLQRNATPLRLAHKASKRDVKESEARLLEHEDQYRFNTHADFYYPDQHLKIDNTVLPPDEVARRIVKHFGLPMNAGAGDR